MKKRLLLLGGADIQVDAIKAAQKLGYYVITCDYLPDNPGHLISDEYHDVSTTDIPAVYELAKSLNIDGISSYASDPGALTAAYVSEKLNLPGNPYEAVKLISDKVTFREIQADLNIKHPLFKEIVSLDQLIQYLSENSTKQFILKPVDSSGSKGIFDIASKDPQVEEKFNLAVGFSRIQKLILEEKLIREGMFLTGDVMIENYKIIYSCYGDVHFNDKLNGLVPRSVSLPCSKDTTFLEKANRDLEKIFERLNITTGVFNIDLLDYKSNPYIIDIGARNGGNKLNNIYTFLTGVQVIELSMKQHMDEKINKGELISNNSGFYCHYVIHSISGGIFKSISFSKEVEQKIISKSIRVKDGDKVLPFINSSYRLGLLLMEFHSEEEMLYFLDNMYDHIIIDLI